MPSLAHFLENARHGVAGRLWQPRALLLLACGWIFWQHLGDPWYGGIVKGLNLGIHELGHILFAVLGDFAGIAGGTVLQIALPLVAAWMFRRQQDYFAIAIAACWLGTNLFDIAAYAADARTGALPLVSLGGGDPEHDWFVMLAETGLLYQDKLIGGMFRGLAVVSFGAGLAFGSWLLLQMRAPRAEAA